MVISNMNLSRRNLRLLLLCRIMRKPFHNDVMDEYLTSLGLWRKPTAKDGSCLFRAVAEQLFHTQAMYDRVRSTCISYMTWNKHKFEKLIKGSFEEHLDNLREGKEWAGQAEINALSLLFKRDFLVYQEIGNPPNPVTHNKFKSKVLLCYSGANHYDSVYPRTYTENAGIAQSLIYELLYSNVFCMEKPLDKAREMMTSKPTKHHEHPDGSDCQDGSPPASTQDSQGYREKSERKAVPFPFKVAKALCPDIYRNTEYDSWIESKKENREQHLSEHFLPGDKCQLTLDDHPGRLLNAHIQEMSPDKGPVTVFIEELGEKRKVAFSCLIPVPQPAASYTANAEFSMRKRKSRYRKEFSSVYVDGGLPPRLQAAAEHKHNGNNNGNGAAATGRYGCRNTPSTGVRNLPPPQSAGRRWSQQHPPEQQTSGGGGRPCEFHTSDGKAGCALNGDTTGAGANWIEDPNLDSGFYVEDDGCGGVLSGSPPPHLQQPPQMVPMVTTTPTSAGSLYMPYYAPTFCIPHLDNALGPINFNVMPSMDAIGQDLPLGDPTSLRFFFNLGVEYYRMYMYMQQQQQQGCAPYVPPPPPPHTSSYTVLYNPVLVPEAGGGKVAYSNGGNMVQLPPTPPPLPHEDGVGEQLGQCLSHDRHDEEDDDDDACCSSPTNSLELHTTTDNDDDDDEEEEEYEEQNGEEEANLLEKMTSLCADNCDCDDSGCASVSDPASDSGGEGREEMAAGPIIIRQIPPRFRKLLAEEVRNNPAHHPGHFTGQALLRCVPLGSKKRRQAINQMKAAMAAASAAAAANGEMPPPAHLPMHMLHPPPPPPQQMLMPPPPLPPPQPAVPSSNSSSNLNPDAQPYVPSSTACPTAPNATNMFVNSPTYTIHILNTPGNGLTCASTSSSCTNQQSCTTSSNCVTFSNSSNTSSSANFVCAPPPTVYGLPPGAGSYPVMAPPPPLQPAPAACYPQGNPAAYQTHYMYAPPPPPQLPPTTGVQYSLPPPAQMPPTQMPPTTTTQAVSVPPPPMPPTQPPIPQQPQVQ